MSRTDAERVPLTGFLAGYRGLTREACALDLRQFASWCCTRPEALFAVRRAGIESFAQGFEAMGRPRAIAAFSPVIYWAVHSTLPHQRISAAVADVETEAFVELENHSSETAPRAAATCGLRDGTGGRRAAGVPGQQSLTVAVTAGCGGGRLMAVAGPACAEAAGLGAMVSPTSSITATNPVAPIAAAGLWHATR